MGKCKKIAFVCGSEDHRNLLITQLTNKHISNVDVFIGCVDDDKSYCHIEHDVIPNIDKVIILDMASVYQKCGLPDDSVNWNREKKPKGEAQEDDRSIEDVVLECDHCSKVFRMIDAKREKIVTELLVEVSYICPECNKIAKIVTTEMEVVEVSKIKTATDIDLKRKYTQREVMQMLGELIKLNTQAKTSWATYIHKMCLKNDKVAYKTALYGYAQEVYSAGQAWRRIMNIYG